jgi:hypothetical protein
MLCLIQFLNVLHRSLEFDGVSSFLTMGIFDDLCCFIELFLSRHLVDYELVAQLDC